MLDSNTKFTLYWANRGGTQRTSHCILNVVAGTSWGFRNAATDSSHIFMWHKISDCLKRVRICWTPFRLSILLYTQCNVTPCYSDLLSFFLQFPCLFTPWQINFWSHRRPKTCDKQTFSGLISHKEQCLNYCCSLKGECRVNRLIMR